MRTTAPPRLVLAALALIFSGCGGGKAASGSPVGACLNDRDFLVQQSKKVVEGMSPGGVNFTLTLYKDAADARAAAAGKRARTTAVVENGVVDFGGNPAQARISRAALAAIRSCVTRAQRG
jgi:hypothetical protein